MIENRITNHPILTTVKRENAIFFWQGKVMQGKPGEPISSALIANGVYIFNHHPKDHAPQSIFCANGQCAQCLVNVDGVSVKACITPLQANMDVNPLEGLVSLPPSRKNNKLRNIEEINIPVLILGGGPAGLSAALELARQNIKAILVEDKQKMGGKLIIQTHRFFGSVDTVHAGTRGFLIAEKYVDELLKYPLINSWVNSTALAVFSDKKVGIFRSGNQYVLVKPDYLIVACGAREKSLSFTGNTLPGVLGAGAFQTLVNRDLVYPGKRVFIIGGGNVGLIAGYHALQAGMEVAGLIELMQECGGYKVHLDNLKRLGVPIHVSHTILSANGNDHVTSVTIAKVNSDFQVIPGTEKTIICDTVLVAIGLDPVDEFYKKAVDFGMNVEAAGDSEGIAEASAAIISGKIKAIKIAEKIKGFYIGNLESLNVQKEILASKPGKVHEKILCDDSLKIFPVIHCLQEIPCDPCSVLCPFGLIQIDKKDIRSIPVYKPKEKSCSGCLRCAAGCPGHAITLFELNDDENMAQVSIPIEFRNVQFEIGDMVSITNIEGQFLSRTKVVNIINKKSFNSSKMLSVKLPREIAIIAAGIQIQNPLLSNELIAQLHRDGSDEIICRCERVSRSEILNLIRSGIKDLNELKAISRIGMGACGGKTCHNLIIQLMKQEKINSDEIIPQTNRPLFFETPLGVFAGIDESPFKPQSQ